MEDQRAGEELDMMSVVSTMRPRKSWARILPGGRPGDRKMSEDSGDTIDCYVLKYIDRPCHEDLDSADSVSGTDEGDQDASTRRNSGFGDSATTTRRSSDGDKNASTRRSSGLGDSATTRRKSSEEVIQDVPWTCPAWAAPRTCASPILFSRPPFVPPGVGFKPPVAVFGGQETTIPSLMRGTALPIQHVSKPVSPMKPVENRRDISPPMLARMPMLQVRSACGPASAAQLVSSLEPIVSGRISPQKMRFAEGPSVAQFPHSPVISATSASPPALSNAVESRGVLHPHEVVSASRPVSATEPFAMIRPVESTHSLPRNTRFAEGHSPSHSPVMSSRSPVASVASSGSHFVTPVVSPGPMLRAIPKSQSCASRVISPARVYVPAPATCGVAPCWPARASTQAPSRRAVSSGPRGHGGTISNPDSLQKDIHNIYNPFETLGSDNNGLHTPKFPRPLDVDDLISCGRAGKGAQAGLMQDLTGNPFDSIGNVEYPTLEDDTAPNSMEVLQTLQRESQRSLGRFVWNVNTGLGAEALHAQRALLASSTSEAALHQPAAGVADTLPPDRYMQRGSADFDSAVYPASPSRHAHESNSRQAQPWGVPDWAAPIHRSPGSLQQPNNFIEETPLWDETARISSCCGCLPAGGESDHDPLISTPRAVNLEDTKPKLHIGSWSEAGQKYGIADWANQDACLALPVGRSRFVVGVFDGHGEFGLAIANGVRDLVAQLAPQIFAKNLEPAQHSMDEVFRRLFHILQEGVSRGGLATFSGTTATVAVIDFDESTLSCAHVGDSRLIVASPDGTSVTFGTVDHEVEGNEAQRVWNSGGEVRERRVFRSGSDLPGLAMSRSIGDVEAHMIGVTSETVTAVGMPFAFGSSVILGSDGIWNVISNWEAAALATADRPHGGCVAARALVSEARTRWTRAGGNIDDVSAVVVFSPPS